MNASSVDASNLPAGKTLPGWPEQEADMALIRRVNDLLAEAMRGTTLDLRDAAMMEARALMPAYGEATSRFRAAMRRAAAH